jgi:hypothetical protein
VKSANKRISKVQAPRIVKIRRDDNKNFTKEFIEKRKKTKHIFKESVL